MIGLSDGGLELAGEAHEREDAVSCRAVLQADRTLVSIELVTNGLAADDSAGCDAAEDGQGAASLVGRVVGRGFRACLDEVSLPGSLPSVLLSELPVVALLSGYGTLYSGQHVTPLTDRFIRGVPVDICAGWAGSGFMMGHIRDEREIPTPDGPPVPTDSAGWHGMPELATGALRRQRLIERTGDEVWAMFRDTYARPDGVTTVLHEYTVTATISPGDQNSAQDRKGGRERSHGQGERGGELGGGAGWSHEGERIMSCEATPRVLPWAECPHAAASAERLVGRRLGDLRALVRDELVGTSTCTHLNDLLSSLSQAQGLV